MFARRMVRGCLTATAMIGLIALGAPSLAQPAQESANGHGTLNVLDENGRTVKRQFSFNALRQADGSVKGHATLINPAFSGSGNPNPPYQLQLDISCLKVVGNIAIMGGMTKRTNDQNLVDAAFFSVQDNGEPGKGNDKISRVFFWDDDPETVGDPQACLLTTPTAFLQEPIEGGNIQVR